MGLPVMGLAELAGRWGVSRQGAWLVTTKDGNGFPDPMPLQVGNVWFTNDVTAWETQQRDAGKSLPGEKPRGPGRRKSL